MDEPYFVEVTCHIGRQSAQTGAVLSVGVACFVRARTTLDGHVETPIKFNAPFTVSHLDQS
jgi:hypothetical protein